MTDILPMLHDEHRRELVESSAIDPEVIAERGYRTASRPSNTDSRSREELTAAGIPTWATSEDWYFPGLIIPWWSATGRRTTIQFKPRQPVPNREGKRMKYASAKGHTSTLDVHPRWTRDRGGQDAAALPRIRDIGQPLYITEGIKKADSLTSRGLVTVALNGVFNWRNALGTLGDWEDIPLKGRKVTVVFDADAVGNRMVLAAMKRLGKWLRSKKADVWYLIPPANVDGRETKGVDDWFAAGATVEDLNARARRTPPEAQVVGVDRFTDAALAEEIALEALEGRYIYTSGLGWLHWNGHRWHLVDPDEAQEAIRLHVRAEYLGAVDRKRDAIARDDTKALEAAEVEERGWHRYQSVNRLAALLKLAQGIEGVKRDASDFDTDPDVINTPSGLLHLDTLVLEPHSSDHLVTRVTAVDYDPTAESPAFKTALVSLPAHCEGYLQARLGQAITGHTPDDDRMVMLAGGGNNGKTLFMSIVTDALGSVQAGTGYAAMIASEMLLSASAKGAATPEKMDLRGVRLAYMEETPEDRYLSVNTLKQVVGTRMLKGRALYKDMITWEATHAIFLNTNHPPKVVETDEGSWRRLQRVDFPYRFRPVATTGEVLDQRGPWRADDRMADVTLKGLVARGDREVLAAAFRWLVEGAQSWYNHGRSLQMLRTPQPIIDATSTWRQESDYIWGFISARMEPASDAWVTSEDFYAEFCRWMDTQTKNAGRTTPDLRTVIARLKGHSGLGFPIGFGRKRGSSPGRSIALTGWVGEQSKPLGDNQQASAIVGVRFADKAVYAAAA